MGPKQPTQEFLKPAPTLNLQPAPGIQSQPLPPFPTLPQFQPTLPVQQPNNNPQISNLLQMLMGR